VPPRPPVRSGHPSASLHSTVPASFREMAELERYEGAATIEKVAALSRRRGFVYPSSDIYGGLGSAYDYGHYGVLLKQNVKAEWQRAMVQEREDIVLLDSAFILH